MLSCTRWATASPRKNSDPTSKIPKPLFSYANLRNYTLMPKLSPALSTFFLTQAHAHHWRKDRIKHRQFLFQSLLKLANDSGELQLSAREIAQLTDLSPRSVQSALQDLEAIGLLRHFSPLKDPQFQIPNRHLLKK